MDQLSHYDYDLPDELIARRPLPRRDASRLLVVHRRQGTWEHRQMTDLPGFLAAGDVLVCNNTRVVPARLFGVRDATGGKWEGLFLGQTAEGLWRVIGQTRGKLQPGELLRIHPAHQAPAHEAPTRTAADLPGDIAPGDIAPIDTAPRGIAGGIAAEGAAARSPLAESLMLRLVVREPEQGVWQARCESPDAPEGAFALLEQFGTVPLPPYIERPVADADDRERYQTVFASQPGAVAAPTAGLHFTPELLELCVAAGVSREFVTLHTGIGTFRPIATEQLSEHQMHHEWCELTAETASRLNAARRTGGRIVAVGTTSVRTLESAAAPPTAAAAEQNQESDCLVPFCGETNLFIRPPWNFRAVDVLLTNFHLPKSSLLVLISALAGRELILAAYADAIRERYRFFSYGDAMLIV